MRKLPFSVVTLLLAGILLAGTAVAQQAPAPKPKPAAPAAKAPQKAPAAKPATAAKPGVAAASALKTQKEKISYALGMSMGKNMAKSMSDEGVDIDRALFARGLKDALTGGKPLLTEAEAKEAIMAFQIEERSKMEAKLQHAGEANKKEGDAFLAANKTKEGVVTLPSGLQYKILTAGTGPKPAAADSVVCNYRGTTLDGKEFDSSFKRGQPATLPVGGAMIKGWTEALQLMPVGSKWQIFIPSDIGFGPRGNGPDIGPNATTMFEVELISIKEKAPAPAPTAAPAATPSATPAATPTPAPPAAPAPAAKPAAEPVAAPAPAPVKKP